MRSLGIRRQRRAPLFKPPPPGTKTNWATSSSERPPSLYLSEEEAGVSQASKWKTQRCCKNLMRRALRYSLLSLWHNTEWHVAMFFLLYSCFYAHCLHKKKWSGPLRLNVSMQMCKCENHPALHPSMLELHIMKNKRLPQHQYYYY